MVCQEVPIPWRTRKFPYHCVPGSSHTMVQQEVPLPWCAWKSPYHGVPGSSLTMVYWEVPLPWCTRKFPNYGVPGSSLTMVHQEVSLPWCTGNFPYRGVPGSSLIMVYQEVSLPWCTRKFPYHGVPGTGVLETGLDLSCAFCNSLARSSSSDFFLASSSSTTIFSSFSLSLSGSLVASPLVTAVWVGVGWLWGSTSPSDNSLGLTEAEGGPVELAMVETPCAAASFAAEESKTSHMLLNFLHAFHKLMSVHHQCSELQHIFNSRLAQTP